MPMQSSGSVTVNSSILDSTVKYCMLPHCTVESCLPGYGNQRGGWSAVFRGMAQHVPDIRCIPWETVLHSIMYGTVSQGILHSTMQYYAVAYALGSA